MGNRIYIAAGILVILIMLSAFILPRFWPWDEYKPNLEAMASEALGVQVSIPGTLDFTLLPQPRLSIGQVDIGGAGGQIGTVGGIEAEFSLMDFLRDRFTVTRLRVIEPRLSLTVDEDGVLDMPFDLPETVSASNISVADAELSGGRVQIYDRRSEQALVLDDVFGVMEAEGVRGPFAFRGSASYSGTRYALDIATSALNAEDTARITATARPGGGGFSVRTDGVLATGAQPSFSGDFIYRQPPPVMLGAEQDNGDPRGDLVFQSSVTAGLGQVLFSDFVLLPDENLVATRFTGNGAVELGRVPRFDVSVEGGVVTLIPPDLTRTAPAGPYGLVALLEGLPSPPIPPLPGDITLSVTELGLQGVRLREFSLDASVESGAWTIDALTATLPGTTRLSLDGTLGQAAGWPVFDGRLALDSQALDALAALWTRPPEGNPLFGQSGRLEAGLRLGVETLALQDGALTLGGAEHSFALNAQLGEQRTLTVSARLGALDRAGSNALLALLPRGDGVGRLLETFPRGSFSASAEAAVVDGLTLSSGAASGRWTPQGVVFDTLSVADYGGLSLEGQASLLGTAEAPQVAFTGELGLARAAPVLTRLQGAGGGGATLARLLAGHLPAELSVALPAPEQAGGAQRLDVEGTAGVLDVTLSADLDAGLARAGEAPVRFDLSASADSADPIFAQFGMAPLIAGIDGALLTVSGRGTPGRSLDTEIRVEGGGESIAFAGSLLLDDPGAVRGQGQASFQLADMGAVMDLAGAPGLYVPAVEGRAELGFIGNQSVTLSGLNGFSGDTSFSGSLTYSAQTGGGFLSGEISVDRLAVETVAAMTAGPAALLQSSGSVWPDGPLDLGSAQRETRGRILFTVPDLTVDDAPLVTGSTFEFGWDQQEIRIRNLRGAIAGGSVTFEAALCCASDFADKSLSGLISIDNADLAALLPEAPGQVLSGRLTASGRFQGNGDSFAGLLGAVSGEGSFSVAGLEIARLSPEAFTTAAETQDLIAIAPEALEDQVEAALDSGPFVAGDVAGVASFTGGDVRIANLAVDGVRARLLGGAVLDLETLRLNANWTLATTELVGGNGLITETTGRIGVGLSGPFWAPERMLDLSQMVDAIQMRALELELDELERLRAEDEARRRATLEEQTRLLEEEARRQAEALLAQQSEEIRQQIEADLAAQALAGEGASEGFVRFETWPVVVGVRLGADGRILQQP